jgi:hypothetical protein
MLTAFSSDRANPGSLKFRNTQMRISARKNRVIMMMAIEDTPEDAQHLMRFVLPVSGGAARYRAAETMDTSPSKSRPRCYQRRRAMRFGWNSLTLQ